MPTRSLLVKAGAGLQRETSAYLLRFSAPEVGEAYMMDPRDTPGYRLHRALSNLNSIDIEQLDSPDRERVVEATTLLEQVGLLTRPGTSEKANTKAES